MIAKIGINATDGKIHRCHFPCSRVAFLPVYGQIRNLALMTFHKLGRLHEHASRPAARIIDPPMVRLNNLNQSFHNASRRIELSSILAFSFRKLGQAVFIGASKNISAVTLICHLYIGEQIHNLAQAALVELLTSEVLGKNILQLIVLRFNRTHSLIDYLANLWSVRSGSNHIPTCIFRHKENILRQVLVAILFKAFAFIHKLLMLLIELVGDVLQEDQAENHILVFRSINVAP